MDEPKTQSDNVKVSLIIDAAQKRFSHYGLSKTTMSEIASDVGLSKASLYYYFADKDSLFRAVVKKEQDAFLNQMRILTQQKDSAQNKFLTYVVQRHEYFHKVFVNLTQLKMTIDHVKPLLGNLIDLFIQAEIEIIDTILKEGIRKNEFMAIDTATYADVFISSAQGLRTLTIKNRNSHQLEKSDFIEIESRINTLAAIFIKSIKK